MVMWNQAEAGGETMVWQVGTTYKAYVRREGCYTNQSLKLFETASMNVADIWSERLWSYLGRSDRYVMDMYL